MTAHFLSPCCIYCLRSDVRRSEEHIIAEGLVGDRTYTVTGPLGDISDVRMTLVNGEVCVDCNSDMEVLDRKLQDEFGILRVLWNKSGTKRHTPASMARPGLYAVRDAESVRLLVNASNKPVRSEGGVIIGESGAKGHAVRAERRTRAGVEYVHFSQPVRITKKVIRAFHKIAFETLCFQKSHDEVLSKRYDQLRRYILLGQGTRQLGLAFGPDEEAGRHEPPAPKIELQRPHGTLDWSARITFLQPFIVDLGAQPRWGSSIRPVKDTNPLQMHLTFDFLPTELQFSV